MKEIKIQVPKGMEIDKENSTFECVKFKPISPQDFKYVDLDLPSGTLWTNKNVGAENEEDQGDYLNYEEALKTHALPSKEQFDELIKYCDWKWVKYKEVNGYLVIGKNGRSLFLPACGYHYRDGAMDGVGSNGCYWSSTPSGSEGAWELGFDSGEVSVSSTNRCFEQPVRLVNKLYWK